MGKEIKQIVLKLYHEGKTNKEIHDLTGFAFSSIRWAINEQGFKSNRRQLIAKSKKVDEFVLGSMLGDGTIDKTNRLAFGHSKKQEEYVLFKKKFLEDHQFKTYLGEYTVNNDRYKNSYVVITLRTVANNITFDFRKTYYVENEKVLPNEEYIREHLTPFALAIWFMDDGNAASHNNLQLNTMSFSIGEINVLRYILLEKYGIKTTINSSKVITIRSSSYGHFINLIDEYIIPSMKYKYKLRVLNKQGELLEHLEADNQQPSLSSNTLEGSTTNSRVLNKDSNADTSTLQSL